MTFTRTIACRRHGGATRKVLALVAAMVPVLFAGCGEGESAGDRASRVAVDVGVLPIADVAPLYLGRKRGFFADENLEVTPHVIGGGEMVPSVVSGDFEFGWSNTTTLIVARSKGLPLRILSRGVRGGARPTESSADILVRRDGPIAAPKDLEGRTISVAALRSVSTLTANTALEKRGVDISKLRYIEIPFPQAIPALESGRVAAAYVAEPFATLGLRAGHRSISRPILETASDYIVATYFTSEEYIAKNADIVDRFDRALNKSFDYAAGHPEEVRRVLATYTQVPSEVAQKMRLPDYSSYTDMSTLALTARLAKKYGYLDKEPTISELLYQP
jgi:NitT/TauT family transport system substrate-binding protein